MSNTPDEILEWNEQMITREAVLQNVSESKKINITLEMVSESKAKAKEDLYQLILTEVIGEDDDLTDHYVGGVAMIKEMRQRLNGVNNCKSRQRQTLAKLFNQENYNE